MLSWRDGVSVEGDEGDTFRVTGPSSRVTLRELAPGVATALNRLTPPGVEEDHVVDSVLAAGGPGALANWHFTLQGLGRRRMVDRWVRGDGRRLATLHPTSAAFDFAWRSVAVDRLYRLSRFAYLHREGDHLILESPISHARVILDDGRSASLIGRLATPAAAGDLIGQADAFPSDAALPFLSLLACAGLVQETAPDSTGDEDEPPELQSWEFHDLLFHARSRKGRTDAPFGGLFRMAGRLEPPAAVGPSRAVAFLDLTRPDLEQIGRDDPPLTRVLEDRRSIREYGSRPITVEQLGEFLYRVAREREQHEVEMPTPRGPVRLTLASRPYPSGGSLYELEFYAVVSACEGLAPGLYHYDAQAHRLGRLPGRPAEVERLVRDAAASAAVPGDRVQVLIVLSARFPRLAWKYASIAYALILKHVGVVYQTMYLTATAMHLAPCALGGGDSDLFARAAGTDYYAETSVGEFLLGSRVTTEESDSGSDRAP